MTEIAERPAAATEAGSDVAHVNHWINGRLVSGASGRRGPVYDPATGRQSKWVDFASLEEVDSGDTKSFRIVGPEEADVSKGTISVTAPMARACINHEVGDEIRVEAPGGTKTYAIIDLKWP